MLAETKKEIMIVCENQMFHVKNGRVPALPFVFKTN